MRRFSFGRAALVAVAFAALAGCESSSKLLAGRTGDFVAKAAGVPQFNAFLPLKTKVAPTEPLPIDGYWEVASIAKQIQIDRGRAYAVEPWLHMLSLKVHPNMVVMKNIVEVSPGVYEADDLPLMGRARMVMQPDGIIASTVTTRTGVTEYMLIPVDYEDPEPPVEKTDESA
ncbi:MAG: hypothetical protein AAFV51_13555 [Pseudomonadota bacterium]